MLKVSKLKNDAIKPGFALILMQKIAELSKKNPTLTGDQLFDLAKYNLDCELSKSNPQQQLTLA